MLINCLQCFYTVNDNVKWQNILGRLSLKIPIYIVWLEVWWFIAHVSSQSIPTLALAPDFIRGPCGWGDFWLPRSLSALWLLWVQDRLMPTFSLTVSGKIWQQPADCLRFLLTVPAWFPLNLFLLAVMIWVQYFQIGNMRRRRPRKAGNWRF